MSIPQDNPHILRRTPTAVDIDDKDKFLKFINSPIYLVLQDKQEIYGVLDSIEKDKKVISVASDIPPVCYTLENTRPIPVCGRVYRVPVNAIAITYFGPAAELQSAWQQWHNRQRPPPVHFRLKESEMDADRGPEYKETGNLICAELYPTTPLDRHMAAVRRYLDGETATLDQAFDRVRTGPGKPPECREERLDDLCWKAFIRRELLEPKRPWRKITAELPDASDSSAFREAMTLRHKAMMARALRFVLEFWGDLRLMAVDIADGLMKEGRNLIIVALVGTNLHIRIFDANGKRVVDKAENELISGDTLTTLKKQLNPLPDESRLSQEQKQQILREATSIAGHILEFDTSFPIKDPNLLKKNSPEREQVELLLEQIENFL